MKKVTTEFDQLPSTRMYFKTGDTIMKEGDPTDGWFVLIYGKVEVLKSDLVVAEITTPGTVIGELGFLLDTPRTASLVVKEPTILLHVTVSVEQLLSEYPLLAKLMMLTLAERLVRTTEDWREAKKPVEAA